MTIETALADYFPSSFLNNPKVGESAEAESGGDKGNIRNLENSLFYEEIVKFKSSSGTAGWWPNQAAEVWGGLRWQLSSTRGQDKADHLF